MQEKIQSHWRCEGCSEVFSDEDVARDCCPPEQVYLCPVCDESYRHEAEARACCPFAPQAPPPGPTPQELEAMGQLRLLP